MLISNLRRQNAFLIIVVMLMSVFGVSTIDMTTAASGNDIIHGGVSTSADLKNKFQNGDGRNSASNIQTIFRESMGVSSANQFDGMVNGTVFRNGNVVVNNEVVATGAQSSGRHNFRNSRPLGNTGAFFHRTDVRFSQGVNSIAALVKLDKNGRYQFAVLKNCGNPVIAVPVKPVEKPKPQFICKSLQASVTRGEAPLSVMFTATAEVQNTQIERYLFDFGDGETRETTSQSIIHVYDEPGTFTASVRIRTAAGTTEETDRCRVKIVVEEKPQPRAQFICEDLSADVTSGQPPLRVDFTARADVENTEIEAYIFDFGDGTTEESANNQVTHVYREPGTFTASVRIRTTDGTTREVSRCKVTITVEEKPKPEVKPAVTKRPPREELPVTGLESTAAGLLGSGSLGVAIRAFVRTRRGLIGKLLDV